MMCESGKYDTSVAPCPTCGQAVTSYENNPEYARSNPQALLAVPDPNCPRATDPDADCTCTVIPNPAPDPLYDRQVKVADWVTLQPCGHVFEASQLGDWKVTRTVKPGWHQQQIDRLRADAAEHGIEVT